MVNNENNFPFADVLQKGLGRAFNYVKQLDELEIRDDLLNACLHNLAYDAQCESRSAKWLFELIHLTGNSEFYRDKIFTALPTTNDFWDLKQLYDLVLIWAKQGNLEAKEIIYRTYEKQELNESWLGGEQIIKLDGIDGLLAVADIFGAKLLEDHELGEDNSLINIACESYGSTKVKSTLEKEALNNINIKAYLNAVKSSEENYGDFKRNRNKNKKIELDYIMQKIEQKKSSFYIFNRFGINATHAEIEQIFYLLSKETRKKQLCRYLWIFKNRAFPKLDNRLFDLAASDDEELQYFAIAALANNKSNSLHDLAIKLIQQQPKSIDNRVLSLFINNYQSGDFKTIESVLTSSQDIDFRHYAGMDLIKIIDAQNNPELIDCALWVYEYTPCSHCRHEILKILIDTQQTTSNILEECLHDCCPDIRALVNV